jgi:hypothetical protein
MSKLRPQPFSNSYIIYVEYLEKLIALIAKGESTSPKANVTRMLLDEHWQSLSPREANLARRLSADMKEMKRI